jgi:hypothetical protein
MWATVGGHSPIPPEPVIAPARIKPVMTARASETAPRNGQWEEYGEGRDTDGDKRLG